MTTSHEEREKNILDRFPFGKPPTHASETPFFPFLNSSPPLADFLTVIKPILMIPIFCLRVVLFILCFVIGYIFAKSAVTGVADNCEKPFPLWRRRILWPTRYCGRVLLFSWGFNWITIKGKPAPREVAPILVSNHVSLVDGIFIFFAHLPIIISAKENLSLPVAGEILKALQVIAVDRASPTSRRDASAEIKRRAICNDWPLLAMFPEGTTTNGRSMVSFKSGAFAPGLPVQPMVIRYPHVSVDPSWVAEGPSMGLLIFRLMTQLNNTMVVEYLDVIEPTRVEKKNPFLFAERCRLTMARSINVGVTEHSFGDVALALEAQKLNPKSKSGLTNVEFGRLERMFRLEIKESKTFLRNFCSIPSSESGSVTVEEFVEYLSLPSSDTTQTLFQLFQPSAIREHINFRDYIYGIAFIRKHPRFDEAVQSLFSHFNTNGDKSLSLESVSAGLVSLYPGIEPSQVDTIFQFMDTDKDGKISFEDFKEFHASKPEYVAAAVLASPALLPLEEVPLENGKLE